MSEREPVLTDFGLVEPAMASALKKLTPEEAAAVWRWGGDQAVVEYRVLGAIAEVGPGIVHVVVPKGGVDAAPGDVAFTRVRR